MPVDGALAWHMDQDILMLGELRQRRTGRCKGETDRQTKLRTVLKCTCKCSRERPVLGFRRPLYVFSVPRLYHSITRTICNNENKNQAKKKKQNPKTQTRTNQKNLTQSKSDEGDRPAFLAPNANHVAFSSSPPRVFHCPLSECPGQRLLLF